MEYSNEGEFYEAAVCFYNAFNNIDFGLENINVQDAVAKACYVAYRWASSAHELDDTEWILILLEHAKPGNLFVKLFFNCFFNVAPNRIRSTRKM